MSLAMKRHVTLIRMCITSVKRQKLRSRSDILLSMQRNDAFHDQLYRLLSTICYFRRPAVYRRKKVEVPREKGKLAISFDYVFRFESYEPVRAIFQLTK